MGPGAPGGKEETPAKTRFYGKLAQQGLGAQKAPAPGRGFRSGNQSSELRGQNSEVIADLCTRRSTQRTILQFTGIVVRAAIGHFIALVIDVLTVLPALLQGGR